MAEMNSVKFLTKLDKALSEFRKQRNDCDTQDTMAHYFDSGLKKFLKDHTKEIDILATMNFDREFIKFYKHFLFKE